MAVRIRGRAVRRAGELLKEVEPQQGARTELSGSAPTKLTRKQAASDAGISRDQMHTALRVANVPAKPHRPAAHTGRAGAVGNLKMSRH